MGVEQIDEKNDGKPVGKNTRFSSHVGIDFELQNRLKNTTKRRNTNRKRAVKKTSENR